MATIEDFKKLNIVMGQIKEVQDHPNADKLYVIKVDLGQEIRQLVAGIRQSYTKEDLINRLIIVIENLESVTIRGEESQGMLLAVSDEKGIALLTPDRDVSLGSVIR